MNPDGVPPWLGRVHEILNFELFELAGTRVTLFTLLSLLLVTLVTLQVSKVAQRAIARAAQARGVEGQEGSVAVAQRLAHYVVLMIGAVVGLQSLGIDLGSLVAAGAVFAVGVGLAMQSLAQNFVSGVILLVERSIKPGDVVEVDGRTVKVRQMGIRSTICRSRDGEDLIIPNSYLVQGIVKNLTFSDRVIRVRMPVGVHYESDLNKVREVLLAAAHEIPWGLPDREPILLLIGFGSSSVDFEISVWADDPWRLPQLRTELAQRVWDALHANGLVIAYPQLDVHLDRPTLEVLGAKSG